MTNDDKPKFSTILTSLAELFDKPLSASSVALYFEALKDIPIENVELAAGRLARTSKFMPRPTDFRDNFGDVAGSVKDRALLAWREVCRHANRYASADVHDPIIAATIEAMGGWVELHSDDRETHWIEKDFVRWYEVFAQQNLPPEVTHFIGLHEANNAGLLDAPKAPTVQIGLPKVLVLTSSSPRQIQ